jgi:hypothetical protein
MERRFRDQRKFEAQRRKAGEAHAKRITQPKAERATEPEEALDGLVEEVDGILLEPATDSITPVPWKWVSGTTSNWIICR